jgi:ATP-binding cassette subfamily C protein
MTSYKTPSRIQVEAIECGAVALWILLGYYKLWLSAEEARSLVNITKDGSSGLDIAVALRSIGFESEGMALSVDELAVAKPACSFPCIAWVNKVHWIVVERFDGKHFLLSDPARGHRLASKDEFSQEYSQLVITAKPTPDFKPEGRKPNPLLSIISTLSADKFAYLFYVMLGVFAVIPVVALSSFVGFFTDTLLEEKDLTNSYIWVLVFLVGVSFLFAYLQKIVLRRTHLSLLARLIEKSYSKLLSLPILFYPLRDLGEISQRITLTVNLSNILTGPLASAVVGLVSLSIYGIIMLSYNIFLGIIVMLLGLVNLIALINVSGSLSKLSQQGSMQNGKMTSNILYIVNNFKQVKANGQESALFQQWADNFSLSQDNSQQSSFLQKRNSATTSFLNQLSDYIIVIMSGLFILDGTLGLGQFMSFRLIALAFLSPINTLAGVNAEFSNAVGDINRLKDLWDASDDPIVSRQFKALNAWQKSSSAALFNSSSAEVTPNLRIAALSYRYSKNADPVIKSADLNLNSGDVISLSGPPGSGKTTLLQCLGNLIECNYSSFTINSKNLADVPEGYVRHEVIYVSQSAFIFNGSAFDNIALFDKSIKLNHVQSIVDIYGLQDFIKDLPQGLDTEVGQSSTIAASSKSIIHLLRALVRCPQILLVDNIFQNIPTEAVSQILHSISVNIPILVFVTQSPSLVAMCNRSLIIAGSELSEVSPSNLIANMISHNSNLNQKAA